MFTKVRLVVSNDRRAFLRTATVRESVPRQVDRESRGPQGERGLEFSRRKKGQTFFSFHIPYYITIMHPT